MHSSNHRKLTLSHSGALSRVLADDYHHRPQIHFIGILTDDEDLTTIRTPKSGSKVPRCLLRILLVGVDARTRYAIFPLSRNADKDVDNLYSIAFASARYNIVPSPAGQLYATSLGIPLSSLTPRPSAELSFREAYGTWIFFLSQPIAIALETVFLSGKKKRIGGMSGRIWVTLWVGGIGAWAVGRSWLALGLAHGVPPVEMWSWHRYVIPTAHLLPMPVFVKV